MMDMVVNFKVFVVSRNKIMGTFIPNSRKTYMLKYPYGNSTLKIQQGDIKEDTSRNTFLQNHFKAQGRTSTLEAERFIMVPDAERERKST